MEELRSHILSLEKALVQPEVRADQKKLKELLAEDFFEFGTSGKLYRREHTIEQLPKTASSYEGSHEIFDFEIRLLGSEYIHATYRSDTTYADGERKLAYRSSVWRKEGDQWRMIFHQGTRMAE